MPYTFLWLHDLVTTSVLAAPFTLRAWDHVVPPSLAVPFGLAWCLVLCRWWLLQLLGRGCKFSVGFLTVGVSLSLVHCRVSLYLFCCGSAEVLGSWSTVTWSVGLVFSTGSHVCFTVFLSPSGAGPGWGFWLGSLLALYIPYLYR